MKLSVSLVRAVPVAALSLVASVSVASAQQLATAPGTYQSTIVSSNPAPGSYNDPQYLADRSPGSDYSGIVAIWMRDAQGNVTGGCTGTNLGGGKILTAAHCVSNGSNLTATSFTARFYEAGTGWVNVDGSGFAVKSGYNGQVVNENDVAVLTMASAAPTFARTYGLASVANVLGITTTLAGYGLTGTGVTGATVSDNIFNDNAVLRTGKNVFETTCITGAGLTCYVNPAPVPAPAPQTVIPALRGVLLGDFDESDVSEPSGLCQSFKFCSVGISNFNEVTIGSGDSGSASFLSDWSITGVASFSETSNNIGGFYGSDFGYTCVANVATDAACQSNYNFVESQITPEPATFVLLGTGLVGVFGVARRRRR